MAGVVPIKWTPRKGGLNSNFGFEDIQDGDLTAARNVRSLGGDINQSPDYVPIRGNEYQYTPAAPVVQNQILEIKILSDGTAATFSADWELKDANGNVIATFSSNIDGTVFNNDVTNFDVALSAALPAFYFYNITNTPIDANSGYIYIEFTDIPGMGNPNGWSWTLSGTVNSHITLTISVTQEAVDETMIGLWHLLGSEDLNGDDFQFWSTGTGLPVEYEITDCIDNGAGLIQIEVPTGHPFIVGGNIKVSFIIGTNNLEIASTGVWIVSAISATTVTLAASTFPGGAVYTSGGIAYSDFKKLGEIGVAVENINTETIAYTRLLRSSELNFRTIYQIDSDSDIQNGVKDIYFTDDYNPPRVFYYYGAYITDGAITAINPDGMYAYGSIASELKLMLNSVYGSALTFESQSQAGGNLRAGNKAYYFRYKTENFTPTQWSDPTNPINVFIASTEGDPLLLKGDAEDAFTGKINNLLLSNIPQGIFKYVELAVVEYIGSSFRAYIVRQDILTGGTTQELQHSGFENNTTELDAGTLNIRYSSVTKARNISILNSRLVLSNLSYQQQKDFGAWCETWEHEIIKDTVPAVGNEMDSAYTLGEYFDPVNVNTKVGYMLNDTYRFAAKFKMKEQYGGSYTQNFWIDDVRFDCEANNVTTPNRRTGAPADYDITEQNVNGGDPYVWYVQFQNIDLTYMVDGVQVRDMIDQIIIERAERIPEILGTGFVVPGVSGQLSPVIGIQYAYFGTIAPITGMYPFISGLNIIPPHPDYPTATNIPYTFVPERNFGFFFCMDYIYGYSAPSFLSGDGLYIYGNPEKSVFYTAGAVGVENIYTEYNGATGIAAKPTLNPIIDSLTLGYKAVQTLSARDVSNNLQNGAGIWGNQENVAANTTNAIADINTYGNADFGFYICQYYRELSDYANYTPDTSKYGNRLTSKYVPTGAFVDVASTTTSPVNIDIYGGDVFCQKTFFKFRYIATAPGMAGGISLYSINTINSQMRRKKDDTITEIYPKYPLFDWLQEDDSNPQGLDPALYYNFGYNIKNVINSNSAYNSNIRDNTDLGATFIWSELKPDGSLIDNFRVFLPLNQKYLSKSDGDITHHTVSNGEILSFQGRRTMRQFFNTTGIITTLEGSEVILGSGAVMARTGQTLSSFGTNHKWSHIKGKTQGGHDVDYIFDIENKTILRVGADGTVDIGLRANYSSFIELYSRWVEGKDTPAYDWGVCGVWFQKTKEAIWTFRAKREVTEFDSLLSYSVGDVVKYSLCSTWNTFEQVDDIFRALTNVPPGSVPDIDTVLWERISIDDSDYYSYFTLVWSEIKNKFQCHHGYHPSIYAKMKNYFLCPRPVGDTGRIYRHEKGNYCEWFDDGVTKQTDNYYFETPINSEVNISKDALSVMLESLNAPAYTEVNTATQITHMDAADYTYRESAWVTPVLMDQTVTAKNPLGSNKGDGSRMYGKYIRMKFQGVTNTYNEFKSFVLKVRMRDRMFNK